MIIVSAFLLIFSLSCLGISNTSNKTEQHVLPTLWQACNNASGSPTGDKFTGKIYPVMNLHPKEWSASSERYGDVNLVSSIFFILGRYDETQWYTFEENEKVFAEKLEEAGAILCVSVKYQDIETCHYEGDIYIIRSAADANAKIITWPDKQVIAEKQSLAKLYGCPALLNPKTLDGKYKVEIGTIDLWDWIRQNKK